MAPNTEPTRKTSLASGAASGSIALSWWCQSTAAAGGSGSSAAKALLIDLDGVIRRWDLSPRDSFESRLGLPEGAVAGAAFERGLLTEAITGRITDEEWRERTVARLAETYGAEVSRRAVEAWSAPAGVVDGEALRLISEVRRRAPVCLVTNATTRLETDLRRLGILDAFDAIASSSRIGARKPDPAIFEAALALVGVSASDALFVDDTRENVDAARALGLSACVYTGITSLEDALRSSRLYGEA